MVRGARIARLRLRLLVVVVRRARVRLRLRRGEPDTLAPAMGVEELGDALEEAAAAAAPAPASASAAGRHLTPGSLLGWAWRCACRVERRSSRNIASWLRRQLGRDFRCPPGRSQGGRTLMVARMQMPEPKASHRSAPRGPCTEQQGRPSRPRLDLDAHPCEDASPARRRPLGPCRVRHAAFRTRLGLRLTQAETQYRRLSINSAPESGAVRSKPAICHRGRSIESIKLLRVNAFELAVGYVSATKANTHTRTDTESKPTSPSSKFSFRFLCLVSPRISCPQARASNAPAPVRGWGRAHSLLFSPSNARC